MAERDRQNRQDIQDEAINRNIDPGTGGSGGALDMGMTTGDTGSNFGEVDPGIGSDLSGATGGPGDVTRLGDKDQGMQANRSGRGPEAGFGRDFGAAGSRDVGGPLASGAGGDVMGSSGTRSAAGAGETAAENVGFDLAGGGGAPTSGTGSGTGSGADLGSTGDRGASGAATQGTGGFGTAAGGAGVTGSHGGSSGADAGRRPPAPQPASARPAGGAVTGPGQSGGSANPSGAGVGTGSGAGGGGRGSGTGVPSEGRVADVPTVARGYEHTPGVEAGGRSGTGGRIGGPRGESRGSCVDDDRPNAGDASESAFDASEAYTGAETDEATAAQGRDTLAGGSAGAGRPGGGEDDLMDRSLESDIGEGRAAETSY